ncbi:universal stress protein [Streptomyces sp. NPDC004647]|uniref:universal stress protein n=1 Tax=Streptomyces sp. NPDC004647 TaxID=3154671 RepID=UPI0033B8F410
MGARAPRACRTLVKAYSKGTPLDATSCLVIGSRGFGALGGMLLGSVALGVAGRASCPTVVGRGGEPNRQGSFQQLVLGVGTTPFLEGPDCAVHGSSPLHASRPPRHSQ